MIGLIIGLIIGMFIIFYFGVYRNNKVYHYRNNVIDYIFSKEDYATKRDIFHQINYHIMVLKFWKPLRSWFPEDWDI